jgi:L-ascorbate metabolism protein UlaG (beta-lactamase superfamily)
MGKPSANIVTISHKSANHSYTEGVSGNPRIVSGPGEYELADILIAGVATSMEPRVGATNTAYVFRVEDMNICHLGDLHDKLTDKQIEEIGSIDVLLLPVGGGGAIGAAQAAAVITQLDPSVVVPMHYRVDGVQADELEPVDPFCKEVGLKEYVPEPKLSVTRGTLPNEVKIVVLENKRV